MDEKQIARRILDAANKKLGIVLDRDVPQDEIDYALQKRWLVRRGILEFEITERGRSAAS
jgi:hypothetical protein